MTFLIITNFNSCLNDWWKTCLLEIYDPSQLHSSLGAPLANFITCLFFQTLPQTHFIMSFPSSHLLWLVCPSPCNTHEWINDGCALESKIQRDFQIEQSYWLQNFGSKEFTLGSGSNAWRNKAFSSSQNTHKLRVGLHQGPRAKKLQNLNDPIGGQQKFGHE